MRRPALALTAALLVAAPSLRSQSAGEPDGAARDATPLDASVHESTREPPPAPGRPYDRVVIVSFDGLRPDGMEQADAPVLRRVRAEGAYALRAETVGDSSTLPSHSSMLTGVEVSVHGMEFDDFRPHRGFIRVPTILYRAHDEGLHTSMFVAKTKLRHIALPGSVDVWSLPHWSCERVTRAAVEHLATAPPGITFVHYEEPDDGGHRYGWMSRRYLEYVARADRCFGTLMAALEARPDRDRTLLLVSADHGGHGRRHGTHNPLDLHIPWIAWGGRVVRGDFDAPVRTTDTAATALAALGLTVPAELTGRVVPQALGLAATGDAGVDDAAGRSPVASRPADAAD